LENPESRNMQLMNLGNEYVKEYPAK
jgi:hypothetical protein